MPYTTQINENQCIGDSLDTINANFSALDTNLATISGIKTTYNTLIRTLTAFAASPATTYYTLSTQFRALSSLTLL